MVDAPATAGCITVFDWYRVRVLGGQAVFYGRHRDAGEAR